MRCPSCGAPGAHVSFNLTHCAWKGCKNYDANLVLYPPEDSEFYEWLMRQYDKRVASSECAEAKTDLDARIDEAQKP